MDTMKVIVPAVPVAQPRAKASSFGGHTRMYTPNKTSTGKDHPIAAFKATVRMAYRQACSLAPHAGPVAVSIVFVLPRPSRLSRKKDPPGRLPHVIKPDRDNLDKAVLDALKGHLFIDDCQVYCGTLSKWYAAKDEQPHVEIEIVKE